ncbi:MAG: arylsulfatase [Opitutaceae bacterium]
MCLHNLLTPIPALRDCLLIAGGILMIAVAPGLRAEARPNIVLIMADDMGYSDIGCYGGEIPTPNLDQLAAGGLRFTQFTNTARCSQTRAALLTGLHPHQTGVGILAEDPNQTAPPDAGPGYIRYLNRNCVTLAEVLGCAGYHTYMAGKWHLGYHDREKWPRQRGFDRFYGIISGASSYFQPRPPRGLTLDNEPVPPPEDPEYYTTDAFADYAVEFIRDQEDDRPFFLYLAFNAPHWPLHARDEDIAKFVGRYRMGWDRLREERWAKQVQMGVVKREWGLSPRDDGARAWDELTLSAQVQLDFRMAVYAAQIHRMDWNIGRVIATLKERGVFENTLVFFLSDNGGCAEPYSDLGGGTFEAINKPHAGGAGGPAHPEDGSSYGTGWANASNTPFRRYKARLNEGGIATPLIVSWPAGLKTAPGSLTGAPGYLADIMATVLEVTGATYPSFFRGEPITPPAGHSLVPILVTGDRPTPEWFFWEHYGERAVRHGDWKALRAKSGDRWELYDLARDRNELQDAAATHPDLLAAMTNQWEAWAAQSQVYPRTTNEGSPTPP